MFDPRSVFAVIDDRKKRNRHSFAIHQKDRQRKQRCRPAIEIRSSSEEDVILGPISVQVGAPDLVEADDMSFPPLSRLSYSAQLHFTYVSASRQCGDPIESHT